MNGARDRESLLRRRLGRRREKEKCQKRAINSYVAVKSSYTKYLIHFIWDYNFDTCLSWDSQVSYVCKKMSYYLYLIKTRCKVLKYDVMIKGLVFSHLTYAMSAWGSSLKQH